MGSNKQRKTDVDEIALKLKNKRKGGLYEWLKLEIHM